MKARHLLLSSCALAALLAINPSPAGAADAKAAQYYEDALQRYEKKDLPGTIVQLKNALKQDRKMLQAHVLLGKALLDSGQAPAAEAAFDEAQRLGVSRAELAVPLARALTAQGKLLDVVDAQRLPLTGLAPKTQAELLLVKAAAQTDLGDPKVALKMVEDARSLDPGNPDGWLAEVPLRLRDGQFAEALSAVDRAKALGASTAATQHELAQILHVQGNLKGALEAYDKALEAQPTLADARVARAGLLIDLRRDADAAKDVALLLKDNAIEPRGWYLSAILADREGKSAVVKTSLTRITELLDPAPAALIRYRPQMMMLNGQAHYGLGQREKAKPYFEGYARLQPASPIAKMLATIFMGEGNPDRAAETLEQYLVKVPNDTQAMTLLASAYMAKGRNARATELMQRALRDNDNPELYSAYGMSLLGAGRSADALTQLETAYRKDPGQTQAAAALAGLYLQGKQTAKALGIAQALVQRQPDNAGFLNLLGMAKAQGKDIPGARSTFEAAIRLEPTLSAVQLNLARLEMDDKQFDRSVSLLTAVLKAEPSNTEAMFELAALAQRLNKPDDVRRWLQKAYDQTDVKDLRPSLALVELNMGSGRKDEALKVAQTVVNRSPDSLPANLMLARVQLALGDQPGALATLSTLNRLAPIEAEVQVKIALLQMLAQNLPGAAYALGKALDAKPDDLRALALMSEVELRQGDPAKAEARAQAVLKLAPKRAIGYSLLGDAAMARKQAAQALDFYRKAHQAEPSRDTYARLFKAQAAQSSKQAAVLAEGWLKAHPEDLAARRLLAQMHVITHNMPAARQEFEKLRSAAPKDPDVANDLANTLLVLKDPQALAVAEQALALAPMDPNIIDTAGWIAFKSDKLDRALQLLRDARLRAPESPVVRYHLGAALAKSGRKAEASEELTAALKVAAFAERSEAETLLKTLK